LWHDWDRDELDKRSKETRALIQKGGIVCLLLTDPFIARDRERDFGGTDLSKRLLAWFQINREDLGTRVTHVKTKLNELLEFWRLYGAAWSSLLPRSREATKTLVSLSNGTTVSVVVNGNLFIIPTLLPDSTESAIQEYFRILSDGVISLWERLREELPEWAAEYRFPGEADLIDAQIKLAREMSDIEQNLKSFCRLKRILVLQSEPLVDAVLEVFNATMPLKAKREEAFREDLKLVDSDGRAVALVEVKGVSGGVGREQVNRADSHRERAGMSATFPSLLIVNTRMKASTSISDKDQSVERQHAARNNVLILKTLDLLNLASLSLKRNSEARGRR
jgi:hypothetical protein